MIDDPVHKNMNESALILSAFESRLRRGWSEQRGSSVQRGRRRTWPSTPSLSRRSSRRANSPSKTPKPTRKHSALLAVLLLLLRSWWLLFFLCLSPSVLAPFRYSVLVPAVSPYR